MRQHGILQKSAIWVGGNRHVALREESRFNFHKKGEPCLALVGPVSPIATNACAGALPFAHKEKTASLTATELLWGLIQSEVALEAGLLGLEEVHTGLAGATTIT
jgi:hypothetical protein